MYYQTHCIYATIYLMNILFLEDDPIISSVAIDFLHDNIENCTIEHCYHSEDALKKADNETYDLYLFDINVPGTSGITLLESLRSFNDTTPAIFITAYQDIEHLEQAFQAGANDLLRKPFDLKELLIRINSLKKLFNIDETITIEKNIIFNPITHHITVNSLTHTISAKESEILLYLIKNRSQVVASDTLLQNIWAYDEMPQQDSIRTYIKSLRQLIGKEHIITIRGEGYRYESS